MYFHPFFLFFSLPAVSNLGKDLANGKAILGVMSQVCPPHVFQGVNLTELLSLNDPETRSVVILDIINKLDLGIAMP